MNLENGFKTVVMINRKFEERKVLRHKYSLINTTKIILLFTWIITLMDDYMAVFIKVYYQP